MTNLANLSPMDVGLTVLPDGTVVSTRHIMSACLDRIPADAWSTAVLPAGASEVEELDVHLDRGQAAQFHLAVVAARMSVS